MPHLAATTLLTLILTVLSTHLSSAGELNSLKFENVSYRIYIADPAEIELHWKDPVSNKPFRTFRALQSALNKKGRSVELIMNAGIFDPGGVPSGLHIENGKELRPINLKSGYGNFYLKPTGIFSITQDGTPAITETQHFASQKANPAHLALAVQSGPLLLNQGKIHPKFLPNSQSKLHRNGVGIRSSDQKIIFAISDFQPQTNRVNLHGFARLFQHLGCENALFLDGDLSQMVVSPNGPIPSGNHLGALITITNPDSRTSK